MSQIIVRYAKKTWQQMQLESNEDYYAQTKELNRSIQIVPGSDVVRYFDEWEDCYRFCDSLIKEGYIILEQKRGV